MGKQKILEEATKYFKSDIGFKRMMEKMKNKYQIFDRSTPREYYNRKSI